MPSTIAADYLESILAEIHDALDVIEREHVPQQLETENLNEKLVEALKRAYRDLQDAQALAEQGGIARLAVFADGDKAP